MNTKTVRTLANTNDTQQTTDDAQHNRELNHCAFMFGQWMRILDAIDCLDNVLHEAMKAHEAYCDEQGFTIDEIRQRYGLANILYARVSTVEQTIEHQRVQAVAAGFVIDEVVADNGVSGVHTRLAERPEGRRLFDKLRAADTLVVRWVDRLGRNYEDVCDTIREFMRRGVIIRTVINGFTFDGSTRDPMQQAVRDALIAFMAAMSQAQAEATKAAQRAGIEHAKQTDDRAYLGRKPSYTRDQFNKVRDMLAQGAAGIAQVAKETGLTRQTVYRIKGDPAGSEAALVAWRM